MRLIIDGFNKTISKRDNQILIKEDGKEIDYFLAKDLNQILIIGKGSITFDAISLLASENVDLISVDWRGNIEYRLATKEHNNVLIRKQQYYALNDERSGYLAKKFIESKIKNQKATLSSFSQRKGKITYLESQKEKLDKYIKALKTIKNKPSDKIKSEIFGIEGMASHEYWQGIRYVVDSKFKFEKRSGRGAKDEINAMLNYSYAILASDVLKALNSSGLDPYAGFLHSDRYGRTSLVYDLMEEFRQQIVDKSVLKLVNIGQIQKDDFEHKDNFIYIKEPARKILAKTILDKLNNKIIFDGDKKTYSEFINDESKKIVEYLLYNKEYKTFYMRW